jgi:hypothetical protein
VTGMNTPIIRNELTTKPKKKNGQIEGEQSLNNKMLFLFFYDSKQDDFVGRWVKNPLR